MEDSCEAIKHYAQGNWAATGRWHAQCFNTSAVDYF